MRKKIKLYKKTISFDKWEFSFSSEIMEQVNKLFAKYLDLSLEVAGYFFSEEQLKNKFHATWTSEPCADDKFTLYDFKLDIDNEKKMIEENLNGKRYLGMWHSHRNCNIAESNIDKKNALNLIRELKEDFFYSLIFNKKEINIIIYYRDEEKIKRISKVIKRNQIWID